MASHAAWTPLLEQPPSGSPSEGFDTGDGGTGSVAHAVVTQAAPVPVPLPPLPPSLPPPLPGSVPPPLGGCASLPNAWRISPASSARALSMAAGLVVARYVFG